MLRTCRLFLASVGSDSHAIRRFATDNATSEPLYADNNNESPRNTDCHAHTVACWQTASDASGNGRYPTHWRDAGSDGADPQ